MDLLPTFAGLAGAAVPGDRVIDGRDIWPLISGQPGAASPHDAFYFFGGNTLWGVRSGKWKLLFEREKMPDDPPEVWARRTGPIIRQLLTDLETDIGETTDLSDQHPEIADRLLAMAERFEQELWASSREVGTVHENRKAMQ
jgi:arylsulfatase A-like enzyme